jgi:hypothetical protein
MGEFGNPPNATLDGILRPFKVDERHEIADKWSALTQFQDG